MKILVIGDAMVDEYVVGRIKRLNPECHSAPLVSVENTFILPGGAANVEANLLALGVEASLVSGAGIIKKFRVVDESGVVCRFDHGEELLPIGEDQITDEVLNDLDALIISDYGKGSITPALSNQLRYNSQFPIFVDTKSHPEPWVNFAKCLFPNLAEFNHYPYDYKAARLTMLKLGSGGAQFYRIGLRSEKLRSMATKVSNVTGAGDTVIAAFATAYCALKNYCTGPILEFQAADFAMQAAAVAVSKPLTYAPTIQEICDAFPGQVHKTIEGILKGTFGQAAKEGT